MHLPTHKREVVHSGVMTCGADMVIDGGRVPALVLEPVCKGPCRFPYVLLLTLQPVTLIPVNYFILLYDIIPVLWDHQGNFDSAASLEVESDSHFATNVLEAFT